MDKINANFKLMYPKESVGGKLHRLLVKLGKYNTPTITYDDLSEFEINQTLLNLLACHLNEPELTPPQIINQPYIPFTELLSHRINQFITIKGIVCKLGTIKPVAKLSSYSCKLCGQMKLMYIVNNNKPTKCDKMGCKSKLFHFDREVSFTTTINVQSVYIQENIYEDMQGRVPKKLEALLIGEHLVDSVCPGDFIQLSGLLNQNESMDNLHTFLLHVNAVQIENQLISRPIGNLLTIIKDLKNDPNYMNKLIHSFCPQINGMEEIKFGLLLSLFGSSKRDQHKMRHQIHVLLLGEPGMGKSVLLNETGKLSPRGFYVCGSSGVSSSGLTISLVRDGQDFAIEAGPLVLADKGHCIIDELDKLSEKNTLLEAMEQGEIRMTKAGLKIHLKARTSVVCAANPKGGHFNTNKLLSENVNLPFPLFNRFDLVFPIFDHTSSTIVDNVIQNRSNTYIQADIPFQVIQAIIVNNRENCHPTLSEPAKLVLKQYYLKLRGLKYSHSNPITIRHLESMIRLSEARAKMSFMTTVNKDHALEIVQLMENTMFKHLHSDITVPLTPLPVTQSRSNHYKSMIQQLNAYHARQGATINSKELKTLGETIGLNNTQYYSVLEKLNDNAYILKNQEGNYNIRL